MDDRLEIRVGDRALRLLEEQSRTQSLLQLLEGLSPVERQELIRNDRTAQTWALGQQLVDGARNALHAEAARAAELAELAVILSQELSLQSYGPELVNDFKARAWACLGEVLRSRADLRGAEEAVTTAESLLGYGTGDLLEDASLQEVKALLRRDQERFEEAHQLLDEAGSVYKRFRDFHQLGRAFVHRGGVYRAEGELDTAIRWLRKGLGLLDATRERRLDLAARHSLMLCLHESGREQEAWFLLKASRPEFLEHGGALLNLRLRWLEGKIQQALGHLREAEEAFLEARLGLVEHGDGFSAALVCLDLAALFARQGQAGEMRRLAEEMLPIFQSRDIHREAIVALIVFQQAIRMEKLSVGLLDEIRSFLQRARTDPKLRFEDPV